LLRQHRCYGKDWQVVGREKEYRHVNGRCPRDTCLLGHEAGGQGHLRHQQVGPFRRRQRVGVRLSQGRIKHLAAETDQTQPKVHVPPHFFGIGNPGRIGSHRSKAEIESFDFRPVAFAGRQDRLMAAGFEAQRKREIGIQIAQRADRRSNNPLAFFSSGSVSGTSAPGR
jgi:hypothetical protein